MENIIPKIDTKILQEKANEYAQKGAEQTIKEFYTGYNSPYMKALEENLKSKSFDNSFTLPDVVASINEKLSHEIDKIANTAIAKTFVPMVTKILTRAPKEIQLSEVLEKYIELSEFDHSEHDTYDYRIEIYDPYKDESVLSGSFVHILIESPDKKYDVHLSCKDKRDDNGKNIFTVIGLPLDKNISSRFSQTMKLSIDGGSTLEMPFTKGVLGDPIVSYFASLVMANTEITFNVDSFEDHMFPEQQNCHC